MMAWSHAHAQVHAQQSGGMSGLGGAGCAVPGQSLSLMQHSHSHSLPIPVPHKSSGVIIPTAVRRVPQGMSAFQGVGVGVGVGPAQGNALSAPAAGASLFHGPNTLAVAPYPAPMTMMLPAAPTH